MMQRESWYDFDPFTGKVVPHGEVPHPLPIRDVFKLAILEARRERLEWWRVSEFLPLVSWDALDAS